MIALRWSVAAVDPVPFALAPQLALRVGVEAPEGVRVVGGFLRVLVRFEPLARAYDAEETARLVPLLGPRERWSDGARGLLWTSTSLTLQGFEGSAQVELLLDCSLDVTAAFTRYFAALARGGAPLGLVFSGTVLHAGEQGQLVASPIPSTAEAKAVVPREAWRELVARHHPDGAWLRAHADVALRLERWRAAQALPTLDHALERLLDGARAPR